MFRYLVAAVAAIYCGLLVFGDENRRPEVARQATDDVSGLTLASFSEIDTSTAVQRLNTGISDADAIKVAMQAGEEHRANRERKPLRGGKRVAKAETLAPATPENALAADLWYVSGTRVNLRAGPGTGNAVVGQLALGDAAEVLRDQDGWYEIRAADGAVSGWIYGKFLSETAPG
ncbi:MAG: SH3 domain-containing protein [Silicimonas sp.]|nr:SH3 domain-containing protein [Silicimonas sp.]